MFMVLKKKQMLIVTLVLMLAIAGYLNYRYDGDGAKDVLSISGDGEPEVGDTAMVNAENRDNSKDTADKNTENTEKNKSADDYFAPYRMEREKTRAKVKEELEKTVNSTSSSDEAKKNAEQQLSDIAKAISDESAAESTLKTKGFEDVVVFINGDSINVTVRSDGLSTADTAKIIDAVYGITKNNNIKIVEVE